MSHDEMIALIQAHKEGKSLEWRYRETISRFNAYQWLAIGPAFRDFDFDHCEYRVKPEKKVEYLNAYGGGSFYGYKSRATADEMASSRKRIACVRIEYTEGQFDA